MKRDHVAPPNAFVYPNDPNAKFPQGTKPVFPDYRSHKMAGAGLACTNVFRSHFNPNAKQARYKTITKTREELDAEEALAAAQDVDLPSSDDDNNVIVEAPKAVSIDELTEMTGKLKIGKLKQRQQDVEMTSAPTKKTKVI